MCAVRTVAQPPEAPSALKPGPQRQRGRVHAHRRANEGGRSGRRSLPQQDVGPCTLRADATGAGEPSDEEDASMQDLMTDNPDATDPARLAPCQDHIATQHAA